MAEEKEKKTEPASDKDETASWLKAAQTIAGDNKLLSTILKFLLSPLAIVVALCVAGFLFYKNMKHKKENTRLEGENKKLEEEAKKLKEKVEKMEDNYQALVEKQQQPKKRQFIDYDEPPMREMSYAPSQRSSEGSKRKNNATFYFD